MHQLKSAYTVFFNRRHQEVGHLFQGRFKSTVIADCKYGTVENYIACQNRKLRTHMADLLASSAGSGRRDEIYPESQFLYRAQSDTYVCPAGQVMRPRRLHAVRQSWEYVTKRGVCLSCRLREFCTRSKRSRSLKRHRDQALLDRAWPRRFDEPRSTRPKP